MSEMPPEQPGGGLMHQKILGMPAPVFILVVALGAYVLFFRGKGGSASSSGGGGSPTTGDITIQPASTTVQVTAPVSVSGKARAPGKPPVHRTPNPQPRPKPKPKQKTTHVAVQHRAMPSFVTVLPWKAGNPPWQSTLSGISRHTGTSLTELLKLNPSIKNPNLIHPGQKIRVK